MKNLKLLLSTFFFLITTLILVNSQASQYDQAYGDDGGTTSSDGYNPFSGDGGVDSGVFDGESGGSMTNGGGWLSFGRSVDIFADARSTHTGEKGLIESSIKSFAIEYAKEKGLAAATIDDLDARLRDWAPKAVDRVYSENLTEDQSVEMMGGLLEGIKSVVDSMQFSGGILSSTVNTSELKIHPNSKQISNRLKNAFSSSRLRCPLSRLGLLGVGIIVLEGFEHSFYAKSIDTIFLAIKDIRKYGVAVLYHELLHAGLEKAKRSGAISKERYLALTTLNKSKFSALDGYVGLSQGLYQNRGYGSQEAFTVGWSFHKIASIADHLQVSESNLMSRALNYAADIEENIVLAETTDGQPIHVIDSNITSIKGSHNQFLKYFRNKDSGVRKLIGNIQAKVKTELPKLCVPGTKKKVGSTYCTAGAGDAAYGSVDSIRVCGDNYRYQPVQIIQNCTYDSKGP